MNKNKVVIIGCGNVGMSYAYALLNQTTSVKELALIDLNTKRVDGEVMDLNHCLSLSPTKMKIKRGTYRDCNDADIIIIAAGVNQEKGETRLQLLKRNASIFKNIITKVMQNHFKGIFLIATNPVDIMTYLTKKYSGMPYNKVIGSGTSLDTSRLRYLIGNKLNIHPSCVHGYVIGEHGDSELIAWSEINIGTQKVQDLLDEKTINKITNDVRNAAYEIIDKKGATYYGIGMCLVKITNAILNNENSIMVVSSYDKEKNVYYGNPAILNKDGIRLRIKLTLAKEEKIKLKNSINVLLKSINNIEK